MKKPKKPPEWILATTDEPEGGIFWQVTTSPEPPEFKPFGDNPDWNYTPIKRLRRPS